MNDFDNWNNLKKIINKKPRNLYYKEREVWWCYLGKNIGCEQNGTGFNFTRPVLIIKGFNKKQCLVAPLTTKTKKNKYLIFLGSLDNKHANLIISQIRVLDTKRLIRKISIIDNDLFIEIKKAIKNMMFR